MTQASAMFVDHGSEPGVALTSWGEMARTRLSTAQTGQRLAILDYRAPAGFGPPRHVHHEDDEIFIIVQGAIALWTPESCAVAGPGGVVFLPHGVPHTWRAYGPEAVHFHVIAAPGQFENFFGPIAARRLTAGDQAELAEIGANVGATFLGPGSQRR